MLLEPVSDEESQCGEEDAEDMESVTMSEVPDSVKYDKEMDIEEERQALQKIKGTLFEFEKICFLLILTAGR